MLVSLLLTSHSKILCICVCIYTHLHTCIHVGGRRRGEERRGRTHSIPGLGHYHLLPPLLQIIPAGLPSASLSYLQSIFNPAARVILIKHVSPCHSSLCPEPSSDFHRSQRSRVLTTASRLRQLSDSLPLLPSAPATLASWLFLTPAILHLRAFVLPLPFPARLLPPISTQFSLSPPLSLCLNAFSH